MVNQKNEFETNAKKLFGKRLAAVRKELGWSQEGLATESGIGRSYLSGVERGQRNIALVNICKLAKTLNIQIKDLMNIEL
jgi:transcriptional regulator with XRE-family HTH domain